MKLACTVAVLVVTTGLTVGCGSSETTPEQQHPLASQACNEFRQMAGDVDTFTNAELRGHLRKVYDKAKLSEVKSVRTTSKTLLTQATDGSVEAEPVEKLDKTCSDLGF